MTVQIAKTTMAEQAASELIAHIETTGLRPGEEIPPESELAQRFGVNRLVIREAIRMLTAREILVSSQGRPARVSTPSASVLAQMLDFRLRQQSLTIEDVLDTRRLVEGELARLAARRFAVDQPGRTAGMDALLRQMEGAVGDRDRFVELDVQFHGAVAEAAGAELLQLILASFEGVLLRTRRSTYDERERRGEGHESTLSSHRAIRDAIAAGDEGAAAAAMEAHLDDTRRDAAPASVTR